MKLSNKKVAWLTPVLGVEGDLLYFEPIYEGLAEKCSEFCIFTAEYKQSNKVYNLNIKQTGKFKRLYPNVRHSKKNREKSVSGISIITPNVIKALLNWKPDVIILNEFSLFSLYGVIANAFLKNTSILFITEAKPRFKNSGVLSILRKTFRKILISSANTILTNNHEGKDYLVNTLGANKQIIIDKPYLVSDISKFTTKPKYVPYSERNRDGCVHFLYVGWLVQPKGLHYALQAFSQLDENIRTKFIFNLVGDGPYRKHLELLAKDLGISKQVVFHGMHPYETLGEFYISSDVFLFPTLNDYRALSPFEALSYGMPILGSIHNGGAQESTKEGVNGFTFDPMNVSQLSSIISKIINNTNLIDKFSIASKEMSSPYTLDNAINTLEEACMLSLKK